LSNVTKYKECPETFEILNQFLEVYDEPL